MLQETVTLIIVVAAAAIALRWAWSMFKRAANANSACYGCALADACKRKSDNKCPNVETKDKKESQNLSE